MVRVPNVSQPEFPRPADLNNEKETSSGGAEKSPISAFILMGKTGSGKSSFINLLGGKDADGNDPEISDELESCTSKSAIYRTRIGGHNIVLLDTPGFDDSSKENIDILVDIVSALHAFSFSGSVIQVRGVIFLHDISETRFAGSQAKTLEILKAICGEGCMGNVIVGTTMWTSTPSQFKKQERREQSFSEKYWKDIFKTTRLPEDDEGAAIQIVLDLLTLPPVILLAQQEMMKPPHTLEHTTVGKLVGANGRQEIEALKMEFSKKETEIELLKAALEKLRHPPNLGWYQRALNKVGSFFGYGPIYRRIKEVVMETGGKIIDGTFEFFDEIVKFGGKVGGDDFSYDIPNPKSKGQV